MALEVPPDLTIEFPTGDSTLYEGAVRPVLLLALELADAGAGTNGSCLDLLIDQGHASLMHIFRPAGQEQKAKGTG